MSNTQSAQERLMEDFTSVVADTERLLKTLAGATGEKAQGVRAEIDRNLELAKARLAEIEKAAVERGRAAALATDEYVHEHPWQSIMAASAVAAIAGVVVGLLIARR